MLKGFVKNKNIIIFSILMIVFSVCYWSFFPGGYTFDSYMSYLTSLGIIEYHEVTSPVLSLYWKIIDNYNFAPLLINYLLFVTTLFLSIKFTKSYYIAIFSLIGICLPYTLITYMFAWKDNALLTVLFMAAILCLNKNKSISYTIVNITLFFIAFSLRYNAIFAVAPLLYYFLISKHSKLKSAILTVVLILGFQIINKSLNKFIFEAETGRGEQSIMYTDIAKINYWQQRNVVDDIPEEFVNASNLDDENVERMFQLYCNFSCNDMLYMYPEWQGAKSFLHDSTDSDAVYKLRKNWLIKIANNPFTYIRVRFAQLNNILWNYTLHYGPESINFNKEVFDSIAGSSEATKSFDRENKIFRPMSNNFALSVRSLVGQRTWYLDLIGYAGLYLILSVIIFIIFLLNRRKNDVYLYGSYVSFSGILYALGYIPIIPCTDYRYFIWTIFSFWVSLGILMLAAFGERLIQASKNDESN